MATCSKNKQFNNNNIIIIYINQLLSKNQFQKNRAFFVLLVNLIHGNIGNMLLIKYLQELKNTPLNIT